MNLRILKKKSKQAYLFAKKYNILPQTNGYYKADKKEEEFSYHDMALECCRYKEKKGKYCFCVSLKGTWLHGSMVGYYQPEWEQQTVFSQIREVVLWSNKKPDGCSDKEFHRIKRVLNIKQKHIDAQERWIEEVRSNNF